MSPPSLDMTGRTCVVTGSTRGIGEATAMALGRLGANVIIVGHEADEGARVLEKLGQAHPAGSHGFECCDLSELGNVRDLARRIERRAPDLDVLINNAGIMTAYRRLTIDGHESTLAVNLLAPALLTQRLRPALETGTTGRVINVSSLAHRSGEFDFADPNFQTGYSALRAYARSKLGILLWTMQFAARHDARRLTANAVHPGIVGTRLGDRDGFISRLMGVARPLLRNEQDAAKTAVYLASSPDVVGISGRYFANCAPRRPGRSARDPDLARRVWDYVESAIRIEEPPRGDK